MRPYSPGGVLNALAAARKGLKTSPHLAPNVYGWDYQGIYTSVTFACLVAKLLTKSPWRIAISERSLTVTDEVGLCHHPCSGEQGAGVQSLRGQGSFFAALECAYALLRSKVRIPTSLGVVLPLQRSGMFADTAGFVSRVTPEEDQIRSNPVCSPSFRSSASGKAQKAAFATGVPPDICAFHRYTRNSTFPYLPLADPYRMASQG